MYLAVPPNHGYLKPDNSLTIGWSIINGSHFITKEDKLRVQFYTRAIIHSYNITGLKYTSVYIKYPIS